MGVLLLGVSPARRFDDSYRDFCLLVAGQVGAAIQKAHDAEEKKAVSADPAMWERIVLKLPVLVSYVDQDFRYRFVNEMYTEWFGQARDEVVGRAVSDVLGEDAFAALYPHMTRALAGERVSFESEIPYQSGTRFIHATYLPDWDRDAVRGFIVLVEDISERKGAEQALRQSETRFRAFVTATSEIVYRMSPDWAALRHMEGQVFVADTSRPSENWLQTYIPPDEQDRVMAAIAESIQSKKVFELEHRVFKADGSLGWTFSRAVPVFGAHGEITEWFGTAHDTTKQKEAELRFARSQQKFAELIERAPFGIYVIDAAFRIVQMNLRSQNGPFQNVRPVIGRDFSEAVRILWPEAVAAEIVAHFRHTLATGATYKSSDFIHERGDVAAVEAYEWELHRIMLADGDFGVVCYYFDSTALRDAEMALRESEARYRALAEQVTDGIFIANKEGRYIDANKAAAAMLGYTLAELVTLDLTQVLEPGELEKLPQQFERLATGDFIQSDWRFRRKDGSVFVGDLIGRQFPDGRLQGVVRDVTQRRQAEDELRRANADLEQFAYSASHDLQEPIRNVGIYSAILNRNYAQCLDDSGREFLGFVMDGSKRMDALIKDLLAYTQCGKVEGVVTDTDATAALASARENLATTIAETKAAVTHGPLPAVRMPFVHLQQIFQNLVGNAIKYRRDGDRPGSSHIRRSHTDRLAVCCSGQRHRDTGRAPGQGVWHL